MPIQVSDSASNRNEQIEHAARCIGRSKHKRAVFEAIHHHKKSVKTVSDIQTRTSLSRTQILKAAGELARKLVIEQVNGLPETAYAKNDFLQQHKKEVLRLAADKDKLEHYPTKRTPHRSNVAKVAVPVSTADTVLITVDDIGNFSKAREISSDAHLPSNVSERSFKRGIQKILGEPGSFKDWGGERNDLLSTRVLVNRRRRSCAFAFKGPGTTGALTPTKMGKNGDQIQRLFQSPADVFIVQYWREINESILEQMMALAAAKSATSGKRVWFGVIDGFDSNRIYQAYPTMFD